MISLARKAFSKIRQYGMLSSFKRYVLLKLIKPFYHKKREDLVLVILNHQPEDDASQAKRMTNESLAKFLERGCVNEAEYEKFSKFIETQCDGYYMEVDEKLAAWAFVQKSGAYQYGNYYYHIPKGFNLLKNLYVRPAYRGKSLGKVLNKTRIQNIPKDTVPMVFVLPENRYAIRNLKMYGFTEAIKIAHVKWLGQKEKKIVKVLNDVQQRELLIEGFNTVSYD